MKNKELETHFIKGHLIDWNIKEHYFILLHPVSVGFQGHL